MIRLVAVLAITFTMTVFKVNGYQEISTASWRYEDVTTESPNHQPNSKCIKPGLMCKNCKELAVCIATLDGGYLKQWTVSNCEAAGGSCRNGSCVVGAKCNYRKFQCSQDGNFPDPYDCSIFHTCSNGNPTPVTTTCEGNGLPGTEYSSAYNSQTNTCGFPIDNNPACLGTPVPRCQQNLQINALAQDPNIYYICTEDSQSVAPVLFKCPSGKAFNSSTFECT